MGLVSSGGGSGVGPSCLLQRNAAVDIHAVGNIAIAWDGLFDNPWDLNPLGAIPAGMGLTFSFDGSSGNITTTARGVWAFTLAVFTTGAADANVRGQIIVSFGPDDRPFGPIIANQQIGSLAAIYSLPSGAGPRAARIDTITAAAANPYNVTAQMCITRLA